MRRRAQLFSFAVFAAALLALPYSAGAAVDGYSILNKAITADDRLSFSGTVTSLVYNRDTAAATVARVEHRAPNSWRLWYVAPADAYGRLILSNESLAYQYEPKTGKIYSNDWGSVSPFEVTLDAGRIRRNYSVQVVDLASVAGHQARTLMLVSNYSHTLVLRLWVDAQTNLVLRRETYHADGTIATKTSFDNIRYVKDLPSELFKMTVPAGMTLVPGADYGKSVNDLAEITTGLSFKPVSPTDLPNGFTFEKGSTAMRGGVQTVQLIYTDGLRSLSIFENPAGRLTTFDGPAPKSLAVGKTTGQYTTLGGQSLLSWHSGDLNFTMVGDLNPKELARIGASLKP